MFSMLHATSNITYYKVTNSKLKAISESVFLSLFKFFWISQCLRAQIRVACMALKIQPLIDHRFPPLSLPRRASWRMCHTTWVHPNTLKVSVLFKTNVIKLLRIVSRVFPWLCNSHCDQWMAHNYMLTLEHRALCEPLNPISQPAALHPE